MISFRVVPSGPRAAASFALLCVTAYPFRSPRLRRRRRRRATHTLAAAAMPAQSTEDQSATGPIQYTIVPTGAGHRLRVARQAHDRRLRSTANCGRIAWLMTGQEDPSRSAGRGRPHTHSRGAVLARSAVAAVPKVAA